MMKKYVANPKHLSMSKNLIKQIIIRYKTLEEVYIGQ